MLQGQPNTATALAAAFAIVVDSAWQEQHTATTTDTRIATVAVASFERIRWAPHNCANGKSCRSASSFVAARRTRKEAAAVIIVVVQALLAA